MAGKWTTNTPVKQSPRWIPSRRFVVVSSVLAAGAYYLNSRLKSEVVLQDQVLLTYNFDHNRIRGDPSSFVRSLEALRLASEDSRVVGLVVIGEDTLEINTQQLEELRTSVLHFSKKKKESFGDLKSRTWIYANRYPSFNSCIFAAAFDSIGVHPLGTISLVESPVYAFAAKKAIETLGIKAEKHFIGSEKFAFDEFIEEAPSPQRIQSTQNQVNEMHRIKNSFIHEAEAPHRIPSSLFGRLLTAKAALRSKLADYICTSLEFSTLYSTYFLLKQNEGSTEISKIQTLDTDQYLAGRYSESKWVFNDKDIVKKIALVHVNGPIGIVANQQIPGLPLSVSLSSEDELKRELSVAVESKEIGGILVRLNSTGGEAIASDSIRELLENASKKKPLVISVGEIAASGGYLAALCGAPIVCCRSSLIGSIGGFATRFSFGSLLKQWGIAFEKIAPSPFMDQCTCNDLIAESNLQEKNDLELYLNEGYEYFVELISKQRQIPPEIVMNEIGQGKIWSGDQAKQHGLVDDVGGFYSSIELLSSKMGVSSDRVQLLQMKSQFEISAKIGKYLLKAFGPFRQASKPNMSDFQTHLEHSVFFEDVTKSIQCSRDMYFICDSPF